MITAFDTEDLMAPEVIADPYGYFGELREHDPVHWNPKWGWWIVTRHADVVHLTRQPHVFSSQIPLLPEPHEMVPPIDQGDWEFVDYFKDKFRTMVRTDRPDHLAMRHAVHRWFTPRSVEKWRGELRSTALRLIEERLPAGEMEVKTEFAVWPPLITISLMLDIPLEDVERLRQLTEALVGIEQSDPHRVRHAVAALQELRDYFEPLVEARASTERADDLISLLAEGERTGVFNRDECIANIVLLFLAGHDTTMSLITNGIANLVRNRDQWELLRGDPAGLAAAATEECLRFEPSIKGAPRLCVEDVEVEGTTIAAGDMVFWVVAAANRDPRVFERPDEFDIARAPNPHVAFGGGIHHCLGAALSRVEAQELFRALAETMPNPELLDERIEYEDSLVFRTPHALRLGWS